MNYTTKGLTDGSCNHRHKTIKEAVSCIQRRKKRHQMSDRTVWRLDADGRPALLSATETVDVYRFTKRSEP